MRVVGREGRRLVSTWAAILLRYRGGEVHALWRHVERGAYAVRVAGVEIVSREQPRLSREGSEMRWDGTLAELAQSAPKRRGRA